MASRKAKIAGAGAGALILVGVVVVSATRDSRRRVTVQTEKVARRELVSIVTASGEVKPKRFVNISANVSGRITDLLVKEGDAVRKGQVLARIDSTRFAAGERQSAAAVQAARADLERAEADLDATRAAFERSRRMHTDKLISDQAFDQAEAEVKMKTAAVDSQKRRIAQGEALLESNQDDLAKTVVASPMDGVVTSLQKEEGEVVIGAQSFQPTLIMTVADLSVMEAEILVDETDIRDVKLGQEAEVKVDALGDVKIKGDVTEIGSSAIPRGASPGAVAGTSGATTSNQAKDFKVVITLKDPPPALRSGLNATAEVTTARKERVLAVPIQAVVVREVDKDGKAVDPGSVQAADSDPAEAKGKARREEKEGVFVVQKGKAVFKTVKTGILGDTEIEILEGLGEGEEIVSGSYKTLRTLKHDALIKVERKRKKEKS